MFASNRGGAYRMYRKPVAGDAPEQLLQPTDIGQFPSYWSQEPHAVLYSETVTDRNTRLLLLPLAPGSKPIPVDSSSTAKLGARLSPSGRWIAFSSNESGTSETTSKTFPEPLEPRLRRSASRALGAPIRHGAPMSASCSSIRWTTA